MAVGMRRGSFYRRLVAGETDLSYSVMPRCHSVTSATASVATVCVCSIGQLENHAHCRASVAHPPTVHIALELPTLNV